MDGDNSILRSVVLLRNAESKLKADSRVQLDTAALQSIQRDLSFALQGLTESEVSDIFITGPIISACECINVVTSDTGAVTDTETKLIIETKVSEALSRLYRYAGEYYTTHPFNYSVRLMSILKEIINECLDQGYYFGLR